LGARVTGATEGATKVVMAAILAAVLCACASDKNQKVEENIYPADYQAQIVKYLRLNLPDPTNIRNAYLAAPAMKVYKEVPRYIACLKFDARDRGGDYDSKGMAVFFFNGSATQFVETMPELCVNAAYQPFPDLQKL
jgi:hypothetical protein